MIVSICLLRKEKKDLAATKSNKRYELHQYSHNNKIKKARTVPRNPNNSYTHYKLPTETQGVPIMHSRFEPFPDFDSTKLTKNSIRQIYNPGIN
ncbi:hypothetical protein A3Q56_06448 [Intoshia linei]|uniref:Uncharacterized protein n=1 Tax=Intoshia linei TaxID=1819745 RepID=A0A177AV34_9BILA|nr:hypothetical protein A3Q56_06448 [Intoshia linei]